MDFAGPINGHSYLVVVDSFSKWPEVFTMQRTDSVSTITVLRRLFTQHGIPETLVSDNGTQFTSELFQSFCKSMCISHIRSPPYHPQSNGLAERFVDTFKRALLKAQGEGTTEEIIQAFLLNYRTTPHPALENNLSPAEALMGRKLRTTWSALRPEVHSEMSPRNNRTSRFKIGDQVYARDYRTGYPRWQPGTITGQRGNFLFEVNTDNNNMLLRHIHQLRHRLSPTVPVSHTNSTRIPIDVLLDTFDIRPTPVAAESVPTSDINLQPRRWHDRLRTPVRRLQVNPKRTSYV